jgi:hypothetical protein
MQTLLSVEGITSHQILYFVRIKKNETCAQYDLYHSYLYKSKCRKEEET